MIIHKHNWYHAITLGLMAFVTSLHVHAGDPSSYLEQSLPLEEHGEIETDRDSFTPATTLVAPSKVMIESAWAYIDNRDAKDTQSLPELLIRYGVSERLELRLGANYESSGEAMDGSNSGGISAHGHGHGGEGGGHEEEVLVLYGLKLDVTDQKRWIPDSAIVVRGATTITEESTSTRLVGTYVFGWTLPNGWTWDTAIRYASEGSGEDSGEEWAPSTVVKIPLTHKTKAHVEYFGLFNNSSEHDPEKHYISPGIHYLLTENLEVGIRVGWGLNDEASRFFTNVGFGWQF